MGAKEKADEARERRRLEVEEAANEQAGPYEGIPASDLREMLVQRTGTGDHSHSFNLSFNYHSSHNHLLIHLFSLALRTITPFHSTGNRLRNVERLQNTLEREDVIAKEISGESGHYDATLVAESTSAFQQLTHPYHELSPVDEVAEECVVMWNEEDGEEQEGFDI